MRRSLFWATKGSWVTSTIVRPLAWQRLPPYDEIALAAHLKKITGPLRRALIYGLISYAGLVVINNSELNLPNMWIAYLPMFIGVYVATQWLDRKIGE